MSYDLCEYNNSHPGMRRQSQALRLVIKQVTNAKLVSQANKPQRSLSRRTLRNSDVASKSKGFFVNMRVPVLDTTKKPLAPTTPRRARLLLKSGKAAVFRHYPFTIILKREIENPASRLQRVYPLKTVAYELVRFDMQLMQNPTIEGVEYQQGELQGFELREHVLIKFNHRCAYAGDDSPCDEVLNVDHVVPRSRGGSNRVSNLVCACRKHNEEKNNLSLEEYGRLRGENFSHVKAQAKAPLKDAAAVNTTRWAQLNRLKSIGLPIETGSGGLTKFN